MAKSNIRRLPIVKKEKVIGLITLRDIIKIEPGLLELVAHKFC